MKTSLALFLSLALIGCAGSDEEPSPAPQGKHPAPYSNSENDPTPPPVYPLDPVSVGSPSPSPSSAPSPSPAPTATTPVVVDPPPPPPPTAEELANGKIVAQLVFTALNECFLIQTPTPSAMAGSCSNDAGLVNYCEATLTISDPLHPNCAELFPGYTGPLDTSKAKISSGCMSCLVPGLTF